VVLKHVAKNAAAIVVGSAPTDCHRFRDSNLDVVDVLVIPQRLEQRVGKPENQDVLNGVLAEIMIDAVKLIFPPVFVQCLVECHGRFQIVPKRFLDNEPAEAAIFLVQPGLPEMAAELGVEFGRYRQVIQAATSARPLARFQPLRQRRCTRGLSHIRGDIVNILCKSGPFRRIERLTRSGQSFLGLPGKVIAEGIVREWRSGDAENLDPLGESALLGQVEQCGDELSGCEIPRCAKDNHRQRRSHSCNPWMRNEQPSRIMLWRTCVRNRGIQETRDRKTL